MDLENTQNFIIPSNSTLKAYAPPINLIRSTNNIKDKIIEIEKRGIKQVGVQWDEMDIRNGLLYSRALDRVVGSIKPEHLDVKTAIYLNTNQILRSQIADKICQFFITSIDGKMTMPIYFNAINKSNMISSTVDTLQKIHNFLDEHGIEFIYTASDGASDNSTIISQLKKFTTSINSPEIFHFYDFLHTCKLLRNCFLNTFLKPGEYAFNKLTLLEFVKVIGNWSY